MCYVMCFFLFAYKKTIFKHCLVTNFSIKVIPKLKLMNVAIKNRILNWELFKKLIST